MSPIESRPQPSSTRPEVREGKRLAIGIVVIGVVLVSVQIGFVVLATMVDAAAPAPASVVTRSAPVGADIAPSRAETFDD